MTEERELSFREEIRLNWRYYLAIVLQKSSFVMLVFLIGAIFGWFLGHNAGYDAGFYLGYERGWFDGILKYIENLKP